MKSKLNVIITDFNFSDTSDLEVLSTNNMFLVILLMYLMKGLSFIAFKMNYFQANLLGSK